MAGSNIYDQIINGSFDALNSPDQLSRMYGGSGQMAMPSSSVADMYSGIYGGSSGQTYQSGMIGRGQPTVGSPYLTAAEKAKLEQQIATGKALAAAQGQSPIAVASAPIPQTRTLPYVEAGTPYAANSMESGYKPTVGPTLDDLAAYVQSLPSKPEAPAVAAANGLAGGITDVTGKMQPGSGAGYQFGDGLLSLITGGKASGLGGLLSMMTGGTQQGGLAGLLSGSAPRQAHSNVTGVGTNGYTYVNGVNMGYSPEVQAQRTAQGKAEGDRIRRSARPTKDAAGGDMSHASRSHQDSVRWQTGY